MDNQKVRFVRIRGKVVPIKGGKDGDKSQAKRDSKKGKTNLGVKAARAYNKLERQHSKKGSYTRKRTAGTFAKGAAIGGILGGLAGGLFKRGKVGAILGALSLGFSSKKRGLSKRGRSQTDAYNKTIKSLRKRGLTDDSWADSQNQKTARRLDERKYGKTSA